MLAYRALLELLYLYYSGIVIIFELLTMPWLSGIISRKRVVILVRSILLRLTVGFVKIRNRSKTLFLELRYLYSSKA